jgi:hypothetical protein
MNSSPIELLPDLSAMATPVVIAHDLPALLAYYTGVLRFRVVQEVCRVMALLENGPVRLQLWQRTGETTRFCRIRLHAPSGAVFQFHAKLARHARSAMVESGPMLRAWGAWEFSMFDAQGNHLIFTQRADA